jgi:fluoride exporter
MSAMGAPQARAHRAATGYLRPTVVATRTDRARRPRRVHNDPMSTSARGSLPPLVAAVSAGGALGALSRHALDVLCPPAASGVSWTILAINVTGSLLIGLLMELIVHRWPGNHLVRPFWGVGFLGGYTTFSAYATDVVTALERGAPQVALTYLLLTVAGALIAAWAASSLAHRFLTHGGGRNP